MDDQDLNPAPEQGVMDNPNQSDQATGEPQLQHENASSEENPPTAVKITDTGTKPKVRKETHVEIDSRHDAKVPDTLPETQNIPIMKPLVRKQNLNQETSMQQPHSIFGQGLHPEPNMSYAQVAAKTAYPFTQQQQQLQDFRYPQEQNFQFTKTQQQRLIPPQTEFMQITNKEIEKLQNDIKRLTQEYQKEKIKYDSQIQFKSYRQNKRHYESTSSDTSHHSEEPKLERTQSFKEKPRKIILLQPSKLDVALNPTITQKLELGNSNVNNLDIHKKQLKNQERYLKNTEKIIETLQILQPHENCEQKTAVSQLVKHLSNEVENQKDEIKYEKQRIEQTDKMAKHFGAFLEIPDIYNISEDNEATKSILEHRNIKSGCHTFNVDINANQNFKDFWDTVLIYTKGFKLSQDSYIRILNTLIQGSASRTFCELVKDNKSLHEILNTLNELFSVRRTVVDDMKDLNNFKRLPNEDIKKTMQKAKVAVERIQHLWDPVLWQQGRKTEILKSVLRQVITTKTRQRLDAEEMKYLKTGTCLSYDAIIEFIDTYENTHNQIPTKEMTMQINVCTGAPKDTQEIEEKNETESKSMNYQHYLTTYQ